MCTCVCRVVGVSVRDVYKYVCVTCSCVSVYWCGCIQRVIYVYVCCLVGVCMTHVIYACICVRRILLVRTCVDWLYSVCDIRVCVYSVCTIRIYVDAAYHTGACIFWLSVFVCNVCMHSLCTKCMHECTWLILLGLGCFCFCDLYACVWCICLYGREQERCIVFIRVGIQIRHGEKSQSLDLVL